MGQTGGKSFLSSNSGLHSEHSSQGETIGSQNERQRNQEHQNTAGIHEKLKKKWCLHKQNKQVIVPHKRSG